jgi:hypothetical protein
MLELQYPPAWAVQDAEDLIVAGGQDPATVPAETKLRMAVDLVADHRVFLAAKAGVVLSVAELAASSRFQKWIAGLDVYGLEVL